MVEREYSIGVKGKYQPDVVALLEKAIKAGSPQTLPLAGGESIEIVGAAARDGELYVMARHDELLDDRFSVSVALSVKVSLIEKPRRIILPGN